MINQTNFRKQSLMSISYLTLKEKAFTRSAWHPPLWNHFYSQQPTDTWPPRSHSAPAQISALGLRILFKWWSKTYTEPSLLSHHSHNLKSCSALLPGMICKTSVIYLTLPVSFLFNLFTVGILSVFYSCAFFTVADDITWTNTVTGVIHSIW